MTEEIRNYVSGQLMQTATEMRKQEVLPEAEVATAFVTVGASIAAVHKGPHGAAEWLRDMADAIERSGTGMPLDKH